MITDLYAMISGTLKLLFLGALPLFAVAFLLVSFRSDLSRATGIGSLGVAVFLTLMSAIFYGLIFDIQFLTKFGLTPFVFFVAPVADIAKSVFGEYAGIALFVGIFLVLPILATSISKLLYSLSKRRK